MKLDFYINYAGSCREDFRFYEQHLGGKITGMETHGGGRPHAINLSPEQFTTR